MKKLVLIALGILNLSRSLIAMEDSKSMCWSDIVSKTKNNDLFLTSLIQADVEALKWRVIPTVKCLKPELESAKPAIYVFFEKVFDALDFKEEKDESKKRELKDKFAIIAGKLNELAYAFTEETKALFVSYFDKKPHLLTIREMGKLKAICNSQKIEQLCINFIQCMPQVSHLKTAQEVQHEESLSNLKCDLADVGISWRLLIRDGLLTKEGSTPLHEAIRSRDTDLVKSLLKNRALINAQDKDGRTPLFFAAQSKSSEIVKLLLDAGSEINAQNCNGGTPIRDAAAWGFHNSSAGNLPVIKMLWEYGASSKYVLEWVAMYNADAVRFLLEKGAKVNEISDGGWTALHFAAVNSNISTTALLLKAGAACDIEDHWGKTPLSYAWSTKVGASREESLTVARMLLDAGVSKNKGGQHDSLRWASFTGDIDNVKHLLSRGRDVNGMDEYGLQPIHYAAKGGRVEAMQLLLEKGADKNALTKDKLSPLALAVEYPEVVRLLMAASAHVDKQNISRRIWDCCGRAHNDGTLEKIEIYKQTAQILGLEANFS